MKVFINPGHDPRFDSGAVNPVSGLRECDVTLSIGEILRDLLIDNNHQVYLLQSDNLIGENSALPCVVETANDWKSDIFISLHCNAANQKAHGTETLVYKYGSSAEQLARLIQENIISELGTEDRGIKERPRLIVLNSTLMPAVLIELAFIDQEDDERLLINYQDKFAQAIYQGVSQYLFKC